MGRIACGLVAPFLLAAALRTVHDHLPGQDQLPASPTAVGNEACAPCHRAIYETYSQTAMARTSGPALPNLIEGSFHHAPSGVSYRVYRQGDRALLSYDRAQRPELHGTQELEYFVGSNTRGRTFLFEIDGFLYQSPINYYAHSRLWDMSPGYGQLRQMELNHPVDATCLFCHSSRVQPRVKGTVNRFSAEPFLQPGVGCERCHGPGSEHVSRRSALVNPATLTADRRDDICRQCHLEGIARIATAGHAEDDYRPGDTLGDVLAIFVRRDAASRGLGAVSQFEALAQSACKRHSDGALTCTTCHDPHVQPTGAAKADYYRSKCLGCHAPIADRHHPEQRDCTACHMPRLESVDIGHTMVTDHRIVRREPHESSPRPTVGALIEFGKASPDPRDLGLAYGEEALRGNAFATQEALQLLERALHRHEEDAEVLTRLGYLYQMRGDLARAQRMYELALSKDPDRGVVAANLGVLYLRSGRPAAALALWQNAFDKNPQLTELGLNLGKELCNAGDATGARQVVERAVTHNPDALEARQLLGALSRSACARR
jgi:hypothetical protein